jgi:DNA-binding response OmpR family regulator
MSDGRTLVANPWGRSYFLKVREFLSLASPDVVFLDLNLPLSLGTDLLRIVRETSSGKRIVLKPLENARLEAIAC